MYVLPELLLQLRDEKKISEDTHMFIDVICFSDSENKFLNKYLIENLETETVDIPSVFIRRTTFGYVKDDCVINHICYLNEDPECCGIIILRNTIPEYLDANALYKAIKPNKNVMFETDSYINQYKISEGDPDLRKVIPHDPIAHAAIFELNMHISNFGDNKENEDDFCDRILTAGKYEYRPFRKVCIYGDKGNIHCQYIAISLMKRGVSHLVFVNEDNKEELKDSSLIIVLTDKENVLNLDDVSEDASVIDISFIKQHEEPLLNFTKPIDGGFDFDNGKKTDKQYCCSASSTFKNITYQIVVNSVCSYSYESCKIGEHSKTGVIK